MQKRKVVLQNSAKAMIKNATRTKNEGVEKQTSRDKTLENRLTCNMNKHPGKTEESWFFVHI